MHTARPLPSLPAALLLAAVFAGTLLDATGLLPGAVLGAPLTLAKIAGAALVMGWTVESVRQRALPFRTNPLTAPLLAVLGAMTVSLAAAGVPGRGVVLLVSMGSLALLVHVVDAMTPEEALPRAARALGLVLLVVMTASLAQAGGGGGVASAWTHRVTGPFDDANEWSTALLVTVPPLITLFRGDASRLAAVLRVGLLALLPVLIVLSASRSGGLVLLPVGAWLLWTMRRRPRELLLAAALAAVPALLLVDPAAISARYASLADPEIERSLGHGSLKVRRELAAVGLALFREHPVLGAGLGTFPAHAEAATGGRLHLLAHNSVIAVAAEQGLVGLLAHAWLAVALLRAGIRGALRGGAAGTGFLVAVLAWGAMSLTVDAVYFAVGWLMVGLGLVVWRRGA